MSKITCLLLTTCLMMTQSHTYANEETGREILDTCLSEQQALSGNPVKSVRYGLCLGYLKGIADTLNGSHFCLPQTGETVMITQTLKQIYIRYALNHNRLLDKPALQTIIPAFKKTFPCNKTR
ncbi:MAG: Rap1a/Tai family immunity protein [Pseudomonadota bacterium]